MSNNRKKKKVEGKITTIKLLEETKLRIEKLREHKRESYDDILKKILERISELRRRMLEEERKQKEDLEKENQLE